jgi:cell fate regulator YaaT (PSP1 superfamily)
MPDIVGVRFKKAGKVYYFDPAGIDFKVQDYVVVQTARGIEMGQVMISPKQVLASEITAELKPVVRKASEEDVKRSQDFATKESNALGECAKMITRLNLPMKLVAAEYNLDGGRLTFYFTAEERVDFRELVRELTAFFKTRIELRQIGPRDQAKIVGGLGRCGRSLCCGSFLTEFSPVSIKMAKEQDLPLDPMKISGVCGRLQCCLAYESAQYHEAKALLPRKGLQVNTPDGAGIVIGGNPLKETVLVELESKASAEFALNQITIINTPAVQPAAETEAATEENGEIEAPLTAEGELPQEVMNNQKPLRVQPSRNDPRPVRNSSQPQKPAQADAAASVETKPAQPAHDPVEEAAVKLTAVNSAGSNDSKQPPVSPAKEETLDQSPANIGTAAAPAQVQEKVDTAVEPVAADQAASLPGNIAPEVSVPAQPAEQQKDPPPQP